MLTPDDDALAMNLIKLHGNKIPRGAGGEPEAFLLFLEKDRKCPLDTQLIRVTKDDLIDPSMDAIDLNRPTNQCFLHHMKTHDYETSVVMGVVFEHGDVLSYVLKRRI